MAAVDQELLDELLAATAEADPLNAALGVGRVLSKGRATDASFSVRALDRDPRCPLPRRTLRTYLAVAEQWDTLGETLGSRLPLSQHVELLAVRDGESKIDLARRAADESWTVKQLRFHAAEYVSDTGRPVHRAQLKQLAKRAAAAAAVSSRLLQKGSAEDSIGRLDPGDANRVAEDLERYRDSIAALAERLRETADSRIRNLDIQRRRATAGRLDKYDRLK